MNITSNSKYSMSYNYIMYKYIIIYIDSVDTIECLLMIYIFNMIFNIYKYYSVIIISLVIIP